MNGAQINALAAIMAANARVEGMRAANQQREALGESIAYASRDFEAEALAMETAGRIALESGQ